MVIRSISFSSSLVSSLLINLGYLSYFSYNKLTILRTTKLIEIDNKQTSAYFETTFSVKPKGMKNAKKIKLNK